MIALSRKYDVAAIHKNFVGAKRVTLNLDLLKQRRNQLLTHITGFHFVSNRWKMAKEQLYIESIDKCAYCEAPTKVVAHGDVEHYRPKSKYWWLAYCYDNYLVSCAVCNEVHKKDEFPLLSLALSEPVVRPSSTDVELKEQARYITTDPLKESQGKPKVEFFSELYTENPLLLNPYFCNPEVYFAYEADDVLQEVKITSTSKALDQYVEETVRVYGLNRIELRNLRYFLYLLYDTYRKTLTDTGISQATREDNERAINFMKESKAPFAGMIRFFDNKLRAS